MNERLSTCIDCKEPFQSLAGGISQLIKVVDGKKSCQGVVVRLSTLSFNKSIGSGELRITDGKHQADLKQIMTWTVSNDRKTLTITFKRKMGDFGTGDDVTVRIADSATSRPNQDHVFQLSTDVL